MANMFQTIQKQGGSQGPEWLSDHPDPGNRYEAINREAEVLRVARSSAPPGNIETSTRGWRKLAPAISSEQAARQAQQRQRDGQTTGGAPAAIGNVEPPVAQWRTYQPGDFMRISVPGTGGRSAAATP